MDVNRKSEHLFGACHYISITRIVALAYFEGLGLFQSRTSEDEREAFNDLMNKNACGVA
jgi:hypothetical protein